MQAPIICAGQMRSGTTWLWEAFKSSPECWVPPLKELRLLTSIDELGNSTCVERFAAIKQNVGRDWYNTSWRPFLKAMREQIEEWHRIFHDVPFTVESAQELEFWMSYIGGYHSLDLYEEFVEHASPKRMVDVSPDYFWCSARTLRAFSSRFADASIIVLLRNPLDRLVSTMKWGYLHDSILHSHNTSEINDWIFSDPIMTDMMRHLNTTAKLQTISEIFGPDKVFIGFFDDIVRQPADFLARLGDFLGIKFNDNVQISNISQNPPGDLSHEFVQVLKGMAIVEAENLKRYIGGITDLWLNEIRPNGTRIREYKLQSGRLSELVLQ